MNDKDDLAGLSALHKTLDDATEALAAFISVAKSGETPPDSLMEAADKTVEDLAEWRARIKEVVEAPALHSDDWERWSNPSKTH